MPGHRQLLGLHGRGSAQLLRSIDSISETSCERPRIFGGELKVVRTVERPVLLLVERNSRR